MIERNELRLRRSVKMNAFQIGPENIEQYWLGKAPDLSLNTI